MIKYLHQLEFSKEFKGVRHLLPLNFIGLLQLNQVGFLASPTHYSFAINLLHQESDCHLIGFKNYFFKLRK